MPLRRHFTPYFVLISIVALGTIKSAIIDNCLTYANATTQRKCTQCLAGFYLKQATCLDCKSTTVIAQPQCKSFIVSSYGANYIASPQKYNNTGLIKQTGNISSSQVVKLNLTNLEQQAVETVPKQQKNQTEQKIKQKVFFQSVLQAAINQQSNIKTSSTQSVNNITQKLPQNNQQLKNKNISDINNKSNLLLYDLLKNDLSNCKKVQQKSEKCLQCFIGFEANIQGACVQIKTKQNKKNNMQNCIIYSEIRNTCIQCENQMVVDNLGLCTKQNPQQTKVQGDTVLLIDQLNAVKSDKQQQLLAQPKPKPKQQEKGYLFHPRQVDDAISIWAISAQPLTLTLTLTDVSKQTHQLKILSGSSMTNPTPTKINIDVDNTIATVVVKAEKSSNSQKQGCMQWIDSQCVQCKQGFFMNILINQCLKINNIVQKPTASNQYLLGASLTQNASKQIQNQSSIASKNKQLLIAQANIQGLIRLKVGGELVHVAIPGSQQVDKNTIANNTNAKVNNTENVTNKTNSMNNTTKTINQSANISQNGTKILQKYNSTSINTTQINNTPKTNQTLPTVDTVPTSTTVAILVNISTSTSTPATTNTSVPTASNTTVKLSSNTTSSPTQNKTQLISITINTSQLKVSNISAKPGTNVSLQKCTKYKQTNRQQCIQCDAGYYLFTGKCYDPIRYRALVKLNNMVAATQIGSNSANSVKVKA